MTAQLAQFGDLYEFLPKSRRPASDGRSAGAFPFFTSSQTRTKWVDSASFDTEAIVFGTGGEASIHHVDGPFDASSDCLVAVPRNRGEFDARYCYRYLVWNLPAIENGFRGIGLKHVSKSHLEALEVRLPPLDVQVKNADLLDRVDSLRDQRRVVLAHLDNLASSVFLELFGDPIFNPRGWPLERLETFLQFRTGKLDANAAVPGGQFPFFTCAQEDLRIDTYAFDCEALLLAGNNASANYSVKHYRGKFNAYQRTYVVTLRDHNNSYQYARSALERNLGELKRMSKGTNTKYLTLELLNRILIPVPPAELQREYERRMAAIDRLRADYNASLERLDMLLASLQHCFFVDQL